MMILGDELHHGLFEPASSLRAATTALTALMAEVAEPPPDAAIVDLGCGTGSQACWLAQRFNATRVVGVSTSRIGVEHARQRAAARGIGATAEFVCADALDSGLPAREFDVIWLSESSQYLLPRERMMRECYRLLSPGGRTVICDVVLRRPLELPELRRLHPELETLRHVFGDAVMGTVGEYRDAAESAGLALTSELSLTERVIPTYAAWRGRAAEARSKVVPLIGTDGVDRFIEGCHVLERFMRDGLIAYKVLAAERRDEPLGTTQR